MKTTALMTILLISFSASLLAAPPPKDGDEESYQVRFYVSFEEGAIGGAIETALGESVPAGMRLIVRNVNQGILLPQGQTAACQIYEPGAPTLLYLPVPARWSLFGGFGEQLGQDNSITEFLIEEGDFGIGCYRSNATGTGGATVTVTGTLVDAESQ